MKIAIIGAGPAGLTSAKQALERGHEIVVYEKFSKIGGIWNPDSGGAYENVRMQSSSMSFHFSDFSAKSISDFPSVQEVYQYLVDYSDHFNIGSFIKLDTEVINIFKKGEKWHVESKEEKLKFANKQAQIDTDTFDAVMVASGELWEALTPDLSEVNTTDTIFMSAKQYESAKAFSGQNVLVVGGGVSGADIAAELSEYAQSVDWSIRKKHLFLPRYIGEYLNDDLFSYICRLEAQEMSNEKFLTLLDTIMPEYMAKYRKSNLLPEKFQNNAIYLNEKIVEKVIAQQVDIKPALECIHKDGTVQFNNNEQKEYDAIVFCLGYGLPNYSFIQDFEHRDLFQHFIYRKDPSLAIVNTPVDTYAFGTACPYFEAIADWVLCIFEKSIELPCESTMKTWCDANMNDLNHKRYYDCWLETIKLALETGSIADPTKNFQPFWNIISSKVSPSFLHKPPPDTIPSKVDHFFNVNELKARVLASMPLSVRNQLLKEDQIDTTTYDLANRVIDKDIIHCQLDYKHV